jgi:superfamily I DNA and/or RNA helicase
VQTVWSLPPQARHDWLVRRVRREMGALGAQYLDLARQFDVAARLHRHIKEQVKAEILGSADVIGLTTTGCAMNQNLLRSINPRILVVEEAAEVLESQLLACIPESIRQVVLIGDHYQLQPKVETFAYQKQNKLALSLFERLVGRTPPLMLTEQRRMKPDIAALVRPFYRIEGQSIEDHPSVINRPFIDCAGRLHRGVPGLVRDVFMWSHKHHEEVAHVGRSKINQLEVRLAVLLVRHLLRNKVPPRSIAVITPYTGQRGAIRGALKEEGLNLDTADSVRVSTVDRFQGDESDIIILSLVRTNQLTDFLKTRNRMVVAVSRARHAMIMLGNPELLNQSPHWKELLDIAAARGCVGESMPIRITSQGGESAIVEVPSSVTAVTWPKP